MSQQPPYPILDETGKVKRWLTDGRGLAVWENKEIGVDRPDRLTPAGCPKPHWAYTLKRTITDLHNVTFYRPTGIVKSWPDSPQGYRAAQAALNKLPDETREAPGRTGTFGTAYTLCRYTMGSITIRPDSEGGTTVRYRMSDEQSPTLLDVSFRVGILRWTAKLGDGNEQAARP